MLSAVYTDTVIYSKMLSMLSMFSIPFSLFIVSKHVHLFHSPTHITIIKRRTYNRGVLCSTASMRCSAHQNALYVSLLYIIYIPLICHVRNRLTCAIPATPLPLPLPLPLPPPQQIFWFDIKRNVHTKHLHVQVSELFTVIALVHVLQMNNYEWNSFFFVFPEFYLILKLSRCCTPVDCFISTSKLTQSSGKMCDK